MCEKRAYSSVAEARQAHRHVGFRLRVYRCPDCAAYHVTNHEKRHHSDGSTPDPSLPALPVQDPATARQRLLTALQAHPYWQNKDPASLFPRRTSS